MVAWLGVPERQFAWTGDAPKVRESSPKVFRHFCDTCGSPLAFTAAHYPGGMHLYAATLADPSNFQAEFHVNWQSKLPWLTITDDLPKYDGRLADGNPDAADYG